MPISRERFVLAGAAALAALGSIPAGAKKAGPIPGCEPPTRHGRVAGPPRKIMLIRHGEKPTTEDGGVDAAGASDPNSLRVQGWQRASALVRFFAAPQLPAIATPSVLFAGAFERVKRGTILPDTKSMRPFQTVSPLAARLDLPIDACFPAGDENDLAGAVLRDGGVVLVAWEHKHIPLIARALPLRDPAEVPAAWPGSRYDMVFVFDLDAAGKQYVFSQVPQLVLPGDSPAPFPLA